MNFHQLNETANRYSVEVNFRTTMKEVTDGFAKMLLGYVSAALKQRGFHVKKMFESEPYRIIISSKHWIDGEYVLVISYNPKLQCFILSKGFYNKDRDTVTIQTNEKCAGHSASEIYRTVFNRMSGIKDEPIHHAGDLKGAKMKTGPKQGSMRPTQSYENLTKFGFTPRKQDRLGM